LDIYKSRHKANKMMTGATLNWHVLNFAASQYFIGFLDNIIIVQYIFLNVEKIVPYFVVLPAVRSLRESFLTWTPR
jgi:hypothetical protein